MSYDTTAVPDFLSDTQLRATAVPVSFTSLPTGANVIGAVTQSGSWSVTVSSAPTTAVTGSFLTDTQLRATAVPVSGTFWQATQPISGSVTVSSAPTTAVTGPFLTDTQLRATAVDVNVTGGVTTGLTDTQLRATAVPVSFTNAALTDAQLRATAVPVTLTSTTITGTAAVTQSGTWTVQPGNTANTTAWKVDGSAVTQPVSGTFWQATQPISGSVTVSSAPTTAVTGPLTDTQLRASTVPVSLTSTTIAGTVASTQSGTWNIGTVTTLPALPANQSTNVAQINAVTPLMGNGVTGTGSLRVTIASDNTANTNAWKVDGSAVTQPVSGTFYQATQPVSIATAPVLVAGSAIVGKVGIDQTTPGTTNAVSFTNTTIGVTGPLTDTQLRASAVPVTLSSTTITGTAAVTQSGTWTVQPGNTANTTAWKVDGSAVTQPVSIATAPVLVAGTALIGKVGIDQTTPFTTNAVGIPDLSATGNLTATSQAVTLALNGASGCYVQITGTFTATATFEGTVDGTNWFQAYAYRPSDGQQALTASVAIGYTIGVAGLSSVRARCSAYTSGTMVVTLRASTGTQTSLVLQSVQGINAAASSVTGNPLRIGGTARTANQTAVADGQASNILTDKMGRLVTVSSHVRDLVGIQQTTITSSTTETTIVTAVASTFLDLTSLTITNSSATATLITLKDSTAGTTRAIYSLAAGGGVSIPFNPPLPQASVNTAWTITAGTSVASIYVAATFVKNL